MHGRARAHAHTHTHTHTHTHQKIVIKEQEKIDKYQVLITELQKVWNVKVVVISVVIGALRENR